MNILPPERLFAVGRVVDATGGNDGCVGGDAAHLVDDDDDDDDVAVVAVVVVETTVVDMFKDEQKTQYSPLMTREEQVRRRRRRRRRCDATRVMAECRWADGTMVGDDGVSTGVRCARKTMGEGCERAYARVRDSV